VVVDASMRFCLCAALRSSVLHILMSVLGWLSGGYSAFLVYLHGKRISLRPVAFPEPPATGDPFSSRLAGGTIEHGLAFWLGSESVILVTASTPDREVLAIPSRISHHAHHAVGAVLAVCGGIDAIIAIVTDCGIANWLGRSLSGDRFHGRSIGFLPDLDRLDCGALAALAVELYRLRERPRPDPTGLRYLSTQLSNGFRFGTNGISST